MTPTDTPSMRKLAAGTRRGPLRLIATLVAAIAVLTPVTSADARAARHRRDRACHEISSAWSRVASLPEADAGITPDPSGGAWLTGIVRVGPAESEMGRLMLVKLTASGKVEWTVQIANEYQGAMNAILSPGSDGSLWVAYWGYDRPNQITAGLLVVSPSGTVQNLPLPPSDPYISSISPRPDGGAWIVEGPGPSGPDEEIPWRFTIAAITADGTYTEYNTGSVIPLPPTAILTLPDESALFVTFPGGGGPDHTADGPSPLGSITPEGTVSQVPGVTFIGLPDAPVAGVDGSTWIGETTPGAITRRTERRGSPIHRPAGQPRGGGP